MATVCPGCGVHRLRGHLLGCDVAVALAQVLKPSATPWTQLAFLTAIDRTRRWAVTVPGR